MYFEIWDAQSKNLLYDVDTSTRSLRRLMPCERYSKPIQSPAE